MVRIESHVVATIASPSPFATRVGGRLHDVFDHLLALSRECGEGVALEVVAVGLPLFGGAQLAIDTIRVGTAR